MKSQSLKMAALVAGGALLVGGVAYIAMRQSPITLGAFTEASDQFLSLLELRAEGKDSSVLRKQIAASLRSVAPEPPGDELGPAKAGLRDAMRLYVEGDYAAAERTPVPAPIPLAFVVRGVARLELGLGAKAVDDFKAAMTAAPTSWQFRPAVEKLQAKAGAGPR